MPHDPTAAPSRRVRTLITAAVALLVTLAGSVVAAIPATAATQGAGFGTWAPISPYGWHGSMLVNGVHTYCITPGAPAPTGQSVDHGVTGSAAGLTPAQLTAINMLVTTYGQTNDPVQASAVGWAVKAIANWDETLHAFGYRGDSLAGAINWTFSRLAPEHNVAVQQRAVAYYDEASRLAAGVATASGQVAFAWDAADHASGTVRVDATVAATGSLALTNAVFADTGSTTREGVTTGTDYAVRAAPPSEGRPYEVGASGRFTAGFAAAVRHYTTPGGQDTAGPAGRIEFDVAGKDSRVPPFSPAVTTQVSARYAAGGPYTDEITFHLASGEWPRDEAGGYQPVAARATVYRTMSEPVPEEPLPDQAAAVGELNLVTDASTGPGAPYTVTSEWAMDEPGFYTAVWTIRADEQSDAVRAHLGEGFEWTEQFGERSQVTMVPDITTRAQPTAVVGESISDTILVSGPVPSDGLQVTAAVYRAVAGVPASETCVPANLVWRSETFSVSEPGEYVVTAPLVDRPGTYYWQERAVDSTGSEVHVGVCGIPNETTTVTAPEAPSTTPPLAETGVSGPWVRGASGAAIALLTVGVALLSLRRRFGAAPIIR